MTALSDPALPPASPGLTAKVENYLLRYISEHQLVPGDEVPSEMQIMDQLGVSRGIVREAFKALGALGLIEIKSGRRPRIRPLSGDILYKMLLFHSIAQQISINSIIELRLTIALGCAELAAEKRTAADLEVLRQELDGMTAAIADEDQERFIRHDVAFHKLVARATHNQLLECMAETLHDLLRSSIKEGYALLAQTVEGRSRIIELHQNIFNCISSCRRHCAMQAMQDHFDAMFDTMGFRRPLSSPAGPGRPDSSSRPQP